MARYKKKVARKLQQDRFRDTTMGVLEQLGRRFEGKGKTIVYGLIGIILVAAVVGFFLRWSARKTDEARRALGRAITIASAPISEAGAAREGLSFTSREERARRAIEEFEKVAAKYGDPYREEARYFIGTNLLIVDREKGISQLGELSKEKGDVGTLSTFALAQAKEADSRLDEAAQLYSTVASQKSNVISPETANLHLAIVYKKQGKSKEASDLLFNLVAAARQAKDSNNMPVTPSAAARAAAGELQKLDANRYEQLPPETPGADLAF